VADSTYSSRWATKHARSSRAPGGDSHVSPGVKKIVTWVAIAFVAFYLISNPEDAAGAIRGIGSWFAQGFQAIITFLTSVFQ
jgi:hypothetical protein